LQRVALPARSKRSSERPESRANPKCRVDCCEQEATAQRSRQIDLAHADAPRIPGDMPTGIRNEVDLAQRRICARSAQTVFEKHVARCERGVLLVVSDFEDVAGLADANTELRSNRSAADPERIDLEAT
jgi:hypothetical protein